jgi:hypothetical protein
MIISRLALGAMLFAAANAFAAPISYFADLSGPAESPPNASPGVGLALVTIDTAAHTLMVTASFSGLLGNTTASHIHAPTVLPFEGTASVATTTPSFPGFPLGVTSGHFSNTYDLTQASSFRAGFITSEGGTPAAAEAALANYIAQGRAYFNVHTTSFGGGEIRGFLQPVPEPATIFGVSGALGLIVLYRRRRQA